MKFRSLEFASPGWQVPFDICHLKFQLFPNNITGMLQTIQYWCNFTSKLNVMARQSISLTKLNDEWLKAQVNSEEYSSKSELVNDLIRQARRQQAQNEWINEKLNKSEANGFTDETKEQILNQSKSLLNG